LTKIQLNLPKEVKEYLFKNYKKENIQCVGFCQEGKNIINLYGFSHNFELWVKILIHEYYHIIFDLIINISDKFHHIIMKIINQY